jgi:hypothetical protein
MTRRASRRCRSVKLIRASAGSITLSFRLQVRKLQIMGQ